jgi:beta-lactamase regulating signal transducer with metallopeptidase domain
MMAIILNLAHNVEGVSRLVASLFVSGLWQGVVLAVGVGVCLQLVPKTTAAVRFAIWTAVFAVLALLPLLHLYESRVEGDMQARGAMVHVDVRWSLAIAAAWLIVSLVRAAKLAMSAVRLRAIWKRAVPVEDFAAMSAAAGFRGVELCTSSDVDRPSVIGFSSPRILIPDDLFSRLTATELEQIVLHEVGHLRRADDWINLLQKLSLVVIPLNPVLMWVERRLCLERELACDDDVLKLTKAPKAYAICLTNLAEHRLGRRVAALSLGAWERRSELSCRVHSILRGGEGMGRRQATAVLSLVVLGLAGGSFELARCPQLVSFSRVAAPVSAEVRSAPAAGIQGSAYQVVAYRVSGNAKVNTLGATHATLLKATMPMEPEHRQVPAVKKAVAKRHRSVAAPLTSRSSQVQIDATRPRQVQGWVVLTTWQQPTRRGVVFAVDVDSEFSPSYAAVPTPGGWLVIQL